MMHQLSRLIGVGLLTMALSTSPWERGQAQANFDLQGQFLAITSDGDFFASSYADGRIPGDDPRYQDALTIVPLPFNGEMAALEISNSVNGPPETMALAPDGQSAYVVEYAGQRPPGATTRDDLPPGQLLTWVDVSNPDQPRIIDQIPVGPSPEAIDVHPSGEWLAIATDSGAGEVLQLVPVENSRLGQPISIPLDSLGIPPAEGPLNASYVEWHPSGQYLALNLYRQNRVVFLKFTPTSTANDFSLELWGEPVPVDPDPFSGRFSPDGAYFITANWQRNFSADTLEGRLPSTPSTVSVIRLNTEELPTASDRQRRHQVTTTVPSDLSSEGIAISPDGTLVATANMRDTALPMSSPRFTREATVSLFTLDSATGQLVKAGDFPFAGVLPEGITFDATGEHLIVATFEYLGANEPTGGLEVWRINREPALGLEYVGRINVPHGAHQVIVQP